jgi:hypothetical protein
LRTGWGRCDQTDEAPAGETGLAVTPLTEWRLTRVICGDPGGKYLIFSNSKPSVSANLTSFLQHVLPVAAPAADDWLPWLPSVGVWLRKMDVLRTRGCSIVVGVGDEGGDNDDADEPESVYAEDGEHSESRVTGDEAEVVVMVVALATGEGAMESSKDRLLLKSIGGRTTPILRVLTETSGAFGVLSDDDTFKLDTVSLSEVGGDELLSLAESLNTELDEGDPGGELYGELNGEQELDDPLLYAESSSIEAALVAWAAHDWNVGEDAVAVLAIPDTTVAVETGVGAAHESRAQLSAAIWYAKWLYCVSAMVCMLSCGDVVEPGEQDGGGEGAGSGDEWSEYERSIGLTTIEEHSRVSKLLLLYWQSSRGEFDSELWKAVAFGTRREVNAWVVDDEPIDDTADGTDRCCEWMIGADWTANAFIVIGLSKRMSADCGGGVKVWVWVDVVVLLAKSEVALEEIRVESWKTAKPTVDCRESSVAWFEIGEDDKPPLVKMSWSLSSDEFEAPVKFELSNGEDDKQEFESFSNAKSLVFDAIDRDNWNRLAEDDRWLDIDGSTRVTPFVRSEHEVNGETLTGEEPSDTGGVKSSGSASDRRNSSSMWCNSTADFQRWRRTRSRCWWARADCCTPSDVAAIDKLEQQVGDGGDSKHGIESSASGRIERDELRGGWSLQKVIQGDWTWNRQSKGRRTKRDKENRRRTRSEKREKKKKKKKKSEVLAWIMVWIKIKMAADKCRNALPLWVTHDSGRKWLCHKQNKAAKRESE